MWKFVSKSKSNWIYWLHMYSWYVLCSNSYDCSSVAETEQQIKKYKNIYMFSASPAEYI